MSVALLAAGCSKELPLPAIANERRIVVLGELTAGDSVYLRAGQSIPVAKGSSLKVELLQGLSMSLKEASSGGAIPLTGHEDPYSAFNHTLPFTAPAVVQPGGVYELTGLHQDLKEISATVTVPEPFTARITDTAGTSYAGNSALMVQVRIDDDPGKKQFYVIEALKQTMVLSPDSFEFRGLWWSYGEYAYRYDSLKQLNIHPRVKADTLYMPGYSRQDIFTNDQHSENVIFGNQVDPSRRILLRDEAFSGQSYTTTVFINRRDFHTEDPTLKGRILIQVKSVSEDYFNYLRQYEQGAGIYDAYQPVQITGNVRNGLGVLGGVYRRQFTYLFDTWEF